MFYKLTKQKNNWESRFVLLAQNILDRYQQTYFVKLWKILTIFNLFPGAGVKMEHFQAALDPRKQELLEARFLGAKVSLKL